MTKEELKKEAIKFAVDYPTNYGKGYKHKDLRIAYLAAAEPREKRIAELEKENKMLIDHNLIQLVSRNELLDKLVEGTFHEPETAKGLKELNQAYEDLSGYIVILAKNLTIDFYNKLKEKDPKFEEAK